MTCVSCVYPGPISPLTWRRMLLSLLLRSSRSPPGKSPLFCFSQQWVKFCPRYHMCPLRGIGIKGWRSLGFCWQGQRAVFETRNMNVALCLFLFSWVGQEDALRCFSQPRELAGPEKCFCESCGKKTAQKQVLFQSIQPPHSLGLPVGFLGGSLQAP